MTLISAIICSCNRHTLLDDAVESLLCQSLPDHDFEILVVDNSPRGEEVAKTSRFRLDDRVRYHVTSVTGLAAARNTGMKAASGSIVAFMDDDAVAARDWLAQLITGFDTFPDAGVIGGKATPLWEETPPSWLMGPLAGRSDDDLPNHQRPMLGNLSVVNWGQDARPIQPGEWLAGVNIAFRANILRKVGGFDEALGRTSASHILLSNEEADAVNRIKAHGFEAVYLPAAVVQHKIAPDRLSQRWFAQRVGWQVISDILGTSSAADDAVIAHAYNQISQAVEANIDLAALLDPSLDQPQFDCKIKTIAALLTLILHGRDLSDGLQTGNNING